MSTIIEKDGYQYEFGEVVKWPKEYRCHIAVIQEGENNYSAIVLNLPGTCSMGTTRDEAIANVREAAVGVIASHLDDGEQIPWIDQNRYAVPEGAVQKWILVNVK